MSYEVSSKGAEDLLKDLKASKKALALSVNEADNQNNMHEGFALKIIGYFETLLSMEKGRLLVITLANGTQTVTIQPEGATKYASSESCQAADHKLAEEQKPTDAIIFIDPGMGDETLTAFDEAYNEIFQPPFVTLGHELIHALHFTTGTAATGKDPITHPDYHDYEEEQTIASGELTENMIRGEHGFPARFGHVGKDQRFPHLVYFPSLTPLAKLAELTYMSAQAIVDANHDIFSDPNNSEVLRMLRGAREHIKTLVAQNVLYQGKVVSLAENVLWDRLSAEDFKDIDDMLGQNVLLAFFAYWDDKDWTNSNMAEGLMAFPELVDSVGENRVGGFVENHQNGPLGAAIHNDSALRRLILDAPPFAQALNEKEEVQDPVLALLKSNATFTQKYILRTMDVDDLLAELAIPAETIIRAANPADILCQHLVIPGWYTHYISETQLVPDELFKALKQRYNVSADKVRAANQQIKWDHLTIGTPILIPEK